MAGSAGRMALLSLTVIGFLLITCQTSISKESSSISIDPCFKDHVPLPYNRTKSNSTNTYNCVEYDTAFHDAIQYIEKNLPSFDVINKGTLLSDDSDYASAGIIPQGIGLALKVRSMYRWAADVPIDIFHEYVISYASVNEARTSWRPVMFNAAQKIVTSAKSFSDAVSMINQEIWSMFGNDNTRIVFKANETPLVYTLSFSSLHTTLASYHTSNQSIFPLTT